MAETEHQDELIHKQQQAIEKEVSCSQFYSSKIPLELILHKQKKKNFFYSCRSKRLLH